MNLVNNVKLGISLLVILAAFGGNAEENQSASSSKVKASDLGVKAQEQKDIDDEITNARLRASTGSKSKISIQTEMAYNGGTFSNPFGKNRPKLSAGPIVPTKTALNGSISAKYRATDRGSINLGSGVGLVAPGSDEQRGQIQNPYLSYTHAFKASDMQNVFSIGVTGFTEKDYVDAKNILELSVGHTILANVGDSKWQLGLSAAFDHEVYSSYLEINSDALLNQVGLYPFAEYAFNDKYSFRTVYRGMTFMTDRLAFNNYKWIEATQSMGLGMAITRDIYLYPNVQWVWRDIRADKTNVALSANINFF